MGSVAAAIGDWLAWLDCALHLEVMRFRERDQQTLDEFRGLYISDETVDRALSGKEFDGAAFEDWSAKSKHALDAAVGASNPLNQVATSFGLTNQEAAALAVGIAAELDAKYATLFAYLNNDVAKPLPSIDLIRRLAAEAPARESVLFSENLLRVKDPAVGVWATQQVFASPGLLRFVRAQPRTAKTPKLQAAQWLAHPSRPLVVVEATPGSDSRAYVEALAHDLDVELVHAGQDWVDAWTYARLSGALLTLEHHEDGPDSTFADVVRALGRRAPRARVVVCVPSGTSWRAALGAVDHETITLTPPPAEERRRLWSAELARRGIESTADAVDEVAHLFAVHPAQIVSAGAWLERRSMDQARGKDLADAARHEGSRALEGLAVRETCTHSWEDLMLPESTYERLRQFEAAVSHRDVVFRDWEFRRASRGQSSLRALFSGESGTGKTMAATVIANGLGLNLYRIDLSGVVSKYIGETEKNLERIFRSAEGSNAILFFDEADALFGKRSEVQDAHDRFANIETAYLLQRMEQHDGVMVLATNLSKNLDVAFSRRIHFEIDFPMPDEMIRERLWRCLIPREAPTKDLDYRFLAKQFALAGGDIRNVTLDAAFVAAADGGVIGMKHLVHALARQRLKQGRIPSASEFKHYFALLQEAP